MSENGMNDDIDERSYCPIDFIIEEGFACNGELTHFNILVKWSGQQVASFSVDDIYNETELNTLSIANDLLYVPEDKP